MMDPFYSAPQSSHHHRHPHTPPYTPHTTNKGKRRLERSDSPASSIYPAETVSPKRKAARHAAAAEAAAAAAADHVTVEELREGDLGYLTDVDVVYPQELEEADSASDGDAELSAELSSSDEEEDEVSIARKMCRMRCNDVGDEAQFEAGRRLRRMSKRIGSRIFKRSHSQSLNADEAQTADADAMDDQDVAASRRRLRRRTQGPGSAVFGAVLRSSVEPDAGYQSVGTQGSVRSFHSAFMTPEREMVDVKSAAPGGGVDEDDDDDDDDDDDESDEAMEIGDGK